jgi:hypothetical protein
LSHLYCYLPLSWKSWNRYECAVGDVGHPQNTQTTFGDKYYLNFNLKSINIVMTVVFTSATRYGYCYIHYMILILYIRDKCAGSIYAFLLKSLKMTIYSRCMYEGTNSCITLNSVMCVCWQAYIWLAVKKKVYCKQCTG